MIRRIAVTALFALLLACDREQTSAPASGAPKQLTRVRANLNPQLTYAPFMIAKEEGFFEQEGIDAELVRIDNNSALVALTTGELDVMSGPVRSGIFNVMLRDANIRAVADKGQLTPSDCVIEAFAASPNIVERIEKNGGSLRGEKFALIRGGFTEFMIDKFLAQRGFTRKDIEFVQIPPGDIAATSKRQFDAIRYVQEPTLSNALAKGLYRVIQPGESVAPGQQHALILYGKRMRVEDPELGRRYMRAYLRGVRKYNEGKTKRNIEIIVKYSGLPVEIIERSCWLPIANHGRVHMESTKALLDWSMQLGYLDGEIPVETWWDPRFVDAANQELGAAK